MNHTNLQQYGIAGDETFTRGMETAIRVDDSLDRVVHEDFGADGTNIVEWRETEPHRAAIYAGTVTDAPGENGDIATFVVGGLWVWEVADPAQVEYIDPYTATSPDDFGPDDPKPNHYLTDAVTRTHPARVVMLESDNDLTVAVPIVDDEGFIDVVELLQNSVATHSRCTMPENHPIAPGYEVARELFVESTDGDHELAPPVDADAGVLQDRDRAGTGV